MAAPDGGALLKMPESILLILRIPDSDDEKVAMMKVGDRLDVKHVRWEINRQKMVIDNSIKYAKENLKNLVVLQILTSDLYHWGFNDIILSGPAKARFIGHIREEIMKNSLEVTKILEERADQERISMEVHKRETMDPVSVALEEASKDYELVFLRKEKKKLFPIFKKTLDDHLKKELSIPVITCQ